MKEIFWAMNVIDIIMIGIGLSMDAATVSFTNAMAYRLTKLKKMMMPVFFGVFQGLMPLLGYFTGDVFSKWISRYSSVVIFIIFGFLGIQMLREGFSKSSDEEQGTTDFTYKILLFQAVATSIDAFAVGIAFCAMELSVIWASAIICITTFVCSLAAILIGRKFGNFLGKKAEILGGVILLLLAFKSLIF